MLEVFNLFQTLFGLRLALVWAAEIFPLFRQYLIAFLDLFDHGSPPERFLEDYMLTVNTVRSVVGNNIGQ